MSKKPATTRKPKNLVTIETRGCNSGPPQPTDISTPIRLSNYQCTHNLTALSSHYLAITPFPHIFTLMFTVLRLTY